MDSWTEFIVISEEIGNETLQKKRAGHCGMKMYEKRLARLLVQEFKTMENNRMNDMKAALVFKLLQSNLASKISGIRKFGGSSDDFDGCAPTKRE